MKNLLKSAVTTAFAVLAFGAISMPANAADWTITQTATVPTSTPMLEQGEDTNTVSSIQSINGIRLLNTEDSVAAGSSQLATITSTTSLQVTQGNNAATSEQAINYLSAQTVDGVAANKVTQTVTSQSTNTTFTQEPTSGAGGNTQAFNIAKTSGGLHGLDQIVTESGNVTITQDDTTTAGNTQAVNYAAADTFGSVIADLVTQTATVTGNTQFLQDAEGGENVQGGNILRSIATTSTTVNNGDQDFTATNMLRLEQDMSAGTDNVQAVNFIDASDSTSVLFGTTNQNVTVSGGITSFQQTASTANNIQAGNFIDTSNAITNANQTFDAVTSTQVDFDQTDGGNALQAGNIIRTGGATATPFGNIAGVSQTFSGSGTNNDFTQNSDNDANIQAANYIDSGAAAITDVTGPHQTFTAEGTVDVDQTGSGNNNIQALNYIFRPDTTRTDGTHALQSVLLEDSTSLKFDQTDGENGIQAGNFVRIGGTGASLTTLGQSFTGSGTNNDIEQSGSASNRIQAMNLVDLTTGSITDTTGPHQTFLAGGSVDMVQAGGGSNNLQALNAAVDSTGSTAAITISQSINPNGTTFTMTQNAVTSSGQFGNYAGARF